MKCPECVRTGQRSTFHSAGFGSSTAMGGDSSYYDEDGNSHYHGVNASVTSYHCSNGHRFTHRAYPRCPSCDYRQDRESWTLQEPIPEKPPAETFLAWTGTVAIPQWEETAPSAYAILSEGP